MTSDTGQHIRFGAHKQLAKSFFREYEILWDNQFDEVDWFRVYYNLSEKVPHLFKL